MLKWKFQMVWKGSEGMILLANVYKGRTRVLLDLQLHETGFYIYALTTTMEAIGRGEHTRLTEGPTNAINVMEEAAPSNLNPRVSKLR